MYNLFNDLRIVRLLKQTVSRKVDSAEPKICFQINRKREKCPRNISALSLLGMFYFTIAVDLYFVVFSDHSRTRIIPFCLKPKNNKYKLNFLSP